MKPRKPEASLPDCNVEAADALMEIFGFKRQETYYALCDAVWEMGLAESRGQSRSTARLNAIRGDLFAGLMRSRNAKIV